MSQGNSKYYLIYDSTKDIWYENVFSLSAFCKENNINESCMRDVVKGRQLYQHKGFFCIEKSNNDKEILLYKINKKKFIDLQIRFNKIKKPLDKQKRYNQSNEYVDFINNIENYYDKLHVKERKSCKTIAKLFDREPEAIRYMFKKYDLPRLNNPFERNYSEAEVELRNFLQSISGELFENSHNIISPLELDCYSEKYKLAFEYCGMYWHSEIYKKNFYHYYKMKKCENNNIRLITIFETEWLYKQEQVKDFIKAILGVFDERIYARNCIFSKIDSADEFFDNNHIQGKPKKSLYTFGLFNNNKLVGAISYGNHHRFFDKMCLNRLVFKKGLQIIGGASKLITNSLECIPDKEILTWSDNRWSTGEIYTKSGFVKDADLFPDYVYYNTVTKKCVSKQSMKKSSTNCPIDKTEHEWALENNWIRIYDCGKKRWKYTKN